MSFPLSPDVSAVLAAGLIWLYSVEQPDGAIPEHHGYGTVVGERRYTFCPAGANGHPVVVVDVAHPQYEDRGLDRVLTNPLGGAAEMDALAGTIYKLGRTVANRWNGSSCSETGSLGLAEPAHPSLLAGLAGYLAGCPTHGTVFCGRGGEFAFGHHCSWLRTGRDLVVRPAWPGVNHGASLASSPSHRDVGRVDERGARSPRSASLEATRVK